MTKRVRTAVLISGTGSNLQALIDATHKDTFPAEIALVISNNAEAFGLTRAADAGISTVTLNHRDFPSREAFDDAIHAALTEHRIKIVCLAGFMRLLTPKFVTRWTGKMINIHPSLLPAFKGLDVHQRVMESGVRFTGCTVHFVVPEMDAGPIIIQAAVAVHQDDDEASLQKRVHQAEHKIFPRALALLAAGKLKLNGQRVDILEDAHSPETVTNPEVTIVRLP